MGHMSCNILQVLYAIHISLFSTAIYPGGSAQRLEYDIKAGRAFPHFPSFSETPFDVKVARNVEK